MKERQSKLDRFAEQLRVWFGQEKLSLAVVQKRLADEWDCKVSTSTLSEWWAREMDRERESELFARIATGSRVAGEVADLAKDAPPDQQTVLKLVETLIVQLSLHGDVSSQVKMIAPLIKRLQDGHRLVLAERMVQVNEGKLEILRKRAETADAAEGVARNTTMTEAEKQAKYREIFGLG